jgi:hypothetical protein
LAAARRRRRRARARQHRDLRIRRRARIRTIRAAEFGVRDGDGRLRFARRAARRCPGPSRRAAASVRAVLGGCSSRRTRRRSRLQLGMEHGRRRDDRRGYVTWQVLVCLALASGPSSAKAAP